MPISELGLETCFQLDLPLATWEHVIDQVLMEGHTSRNDMATSVYWRARHRQERTT